MHIDRQLFHLLLIPPDQTLITFFEAHCACGDKHPAKLIRFFIQRHSMSADRQNSRSLHTADTAADDHDLFLRFGRLKLICILPAHSRIQRAAHVLTFEDPFQASLMAGNTRTDIIGISFFQLIAVIRIRQKLSGNTDPCYFSALHSLQCQLWFFHTSRTEHRN